MWVTFSPVFESKKEAILALVNPPSVQLMSCKKIQFAEAQGGMSQLAQQSELNRENLYRTLSLKGNPR